MIMRFRFFEKINTGRLLSILYEAVVLAILIMSLALLSGYYATDGFAADKTLNTSLPKKHYTIPAGSLGKALAVYASEAGVVLAFDPAMTDGKTTLGINGEFGLIEGFNGILKNSGLEIINSDKGDYTLKKAPVITAKPSNLPLDIELKETQVRAKRFYEIGPMPGLGLTKEEIPGNVQSISAKEIKAAHSLSITDLMNSKLQSVNVNDYQSNPFQMDVTYRGFTASPQLGTSQGLSVFLDGIRVNEPFGDVVNWDMIPLNALSSLDVFPGSNPIFGLGTLGGAISMRTKSGFTDKGGTAEILTGSFGRKQFQGSWGDNNGVVAGFVAANIFNEDGWRKNSASSVNQLFGKAEWRNDKLQLGLSTLFAGNDLIGNGLLPSEGIKQDPSNVFTSPDETKNRLLQFQLSSIWDVTDNFNITGQIYRRNSKRNASTGDVNTDFGGTATRKALPGERVAPGYADINQDGLPDYRSFAYNVAADANGYALDANGNSRLIDVGGGDFQPNPAFDKNNLAIGTLANQQVIAQQATFIGSDGKSHLAWAALNDTIFLDPNTPRNAPLPTAYYQFALNWFKHNENLTQKNDLTPNNPEYYVNPTLIGINNYYNFSSDGSPILGFTDDKGFYNALIIDPEILANPFILAAANVGYRLGKPLILPVYDANGYDIQRNGADVDPTSLAPRAGYVDGTPIGLITTTDINQISDGGAIQLNWNLDHHKFMLGASIDMAESTYKSAQQVALIDANHRVYADPVNIGDEFTAKDYGIGLNNFSGESTTKSLYASETWSPVDTLHLNAAVRYNHTNIKNQLDVINTAGLRGTSSFLNFYQQAVLCTGVLPDGSPDPASCPQAQMLPFSIDRAQGLGAIRKGEIENFKYQSLNPAFGATWQMNPTTNIYANWSQGARTPSVIELGCAYDDSPVNVQIDPSQPPAYRPRSLYERRFCSLPSILAGDPYLPQVVSKTTEVGARGYWGEDIEWNASVYQTNLEDDIYFLAVTPDRNFFKTIGATRRQGLEMGIKGKSGRATFRVNYSLTDATFESSFLLDSPNNSSAGTTGYAVSPIIGNTIGNIPNFGQIQVNPGNRMPGVPLHNINASFAYDITEKWNMGISMVLHSDAYVRGNENNQHQAGALEPFHVVVQDPNDGTKNIVVDVARPPARYSGKTAGYAVFNFQTSYKLAPEWTLGLQVSNIFDRDYQSAGRLGINPFSPSINGVVGPSGFNYNSNDWRTSTFLAPGAPRAAWISLTYDFDVSR